MKNIMWMFSLLCGLMIGCRTDLFCSHTTGQGKTKCKVLSSQAEEQVWVKKGEGKYYTAKSSEYGKGDGSLVTPRDADLLGFAAGDKISVDRGRDPSAKDERLTLGDRLKELKALKDAGLLTEEEYEQKRRDIIDQY